MTETRSSLRRLRTRLRIIIFGTETPGGRLFDVVLLVFIISSVIAVLLESVQEFREQYGTQLYWAEWVFTIVFTIEYIFRLATIGRPLRYARSFFGVVDLIAIIPTYLSLLIPGAQALLVIRALRLLRVFRVLKLIHYVGEASMLGAAMRASVRKIMIFLFVVLNIVLIVGATLYVIEGPEYGFTSIPLSMYWAIVSMTTVGYGDIVPGTPIGKLIASALMITGYAIIAVPTGIVSVEMASVARSDRAKSERTTREECRRCRTGQHDVDDRFCRSCGRRLN